MILVIILRIVNGRKKTREIDIFLPSQEYEGQSTPEAKLVKDFDRLDMVLQAFEYEKKEGPSSAGRLEEFFTSTEGKFSSPFVQSIVQELKLQRQNSPK